MPNTRRLLISVLLGLAAGVICHVLLTYRHVKAADFTWPLHGAQTLFSGGDPYDDPSLARDVPYAQEAPLWYPLPAVIASLPFSLLPYPLAGALFFGLSSALLAWGLLKDNYWRMLIFLSVPYWIALGNVNWIVLVTAAALIPGLEWLYVTKPNVGLALFASRPTRRAAILCTAAIIVSLLVRPLWPLGWLEALHVAPQRLLVPIMVFPGFLILLAALRWRDEKARLLLVMGLVPQQLLFYDQLPLMLIPASRRSLLATSLLGWLGFFAFMVLPGGEHWTVLMLYIPVLPLVLHPLLNRLWERLTVGHVDDR